LIWNLTIRRPVLTVVAFLVLVIFGTWGWLQMPMRENPDVEFPIVSVNVVYPGAEPEVIESEIIEPLEEEINTAEGVKTLTSTAREQVGTITAEFELWRDVDVAAQDVRDRVSRARRELPQEAEAPVVRKLDPDARAIMWIALTGDDSWGEMRLSTYADEVIKPRLENLRGVGRVIVGGERRFAVRIRLDPERLAGRGVTALEVVEAIRRNNVDIPTGRVESAYREFLVKTQGQFAGPEPFNDLIVATGPGGVVRLADVGRAGAGIENQRQAARFTRQPSVGLGVVKRSGGNTVAVAAAARERMQALAPEFPSGLDYTIATDDSVYVRQSIRDLVFTIGLTAGLVVLVVLVFLRNLGGTFIAALAIPASLCGGAAAMHLLGFSVNTLTMLGLILAIGIVIDDAIVVLENVYRHQQEGADPVPAARAGTTEVAFPSLANTLSLAAVFIPVAFTAGIIGRYFLEFSLTVAVTVFASTLTALTLTPMLCARLLRVSPGGGRLRRLSERGFAALDGAYAWLLDRALGHKLLALALALAAFAAGAWLFQDLSREFAPEVDRSQFVVSFRTPEGATLARTDQYARELERILTQREEVDHFFLAIGLAQGGGPGKVNEGIIFVHLVPRQRRALHQTAVMQQLRQRFARLPQGRAFIYSGGGGPGAGQAPLKVVLQSPDLEALVRQQEKVMAWMRENTRLIGVNSNLRLNKPQLLVRVDRDQALEMGVSMAAVANTLRYLLGEPDISTVERRSERYEVITEAAGQGTMTPADLAGLHLRNRAGELVPLGNLARISESIGPSEIHHFGRIRAATISASTPPGVPLGDALGRLTAYLERSLPPGFQHTLTGQSQDFRESFHYLTIALAFSVVFIFLVLSAQFESFLSALVILVALPLALVGAAGALWLLGLPLGIFAYIGFIMLAGMATKNAILMIDYTRVLMARGRELEEAARSAARVRFRPVIMTTISTVLGMTPIAVGFGAGGEARAPMGVAVAAGLSATTLLTLVVLPVLFIVAMRGRAWAAARLSRRKEEPA
jgi:hydrophobe/amphiphile efflux-1 (HAE1) family protein